LQFSIDILLYLRNGATLFGWSLTALSVQKWCKDGDIATMED